MRLADKVAIVTGGGSAGERGGMGRATALLLAREGAAVVVADADLPAAEDTAAQIRSAGGRAVAAHTDMARPDEVRHMVDLALEHFGRLDVLHNHAGTFATYPVVDLPEADWDRVMSINVKSAYVACKAAIPHMIASGGGSIINTASISGLRADYGLAAYNASKGALINLTRSIAVDYGRFGIRANCVCPGQITGPGFERSLRQAGPMVRRHFLGRYPIRRFGTAEEVANIVLFLASDESSLITGETILADGGLSAHTGHPMWRADGSIGIPGDELGE
jgi:meso-butanediol dehydrogenase/(S,S)-butanediol dehydrogenase/diacetyl reductase